MRSKIAHGKLAAAHAAHMLAVLAPGDVAHHPEVWSSDFHVGH